MSIDFAWLEEKVFGRKLSDGETAAVEEALESATAAPGGTLVEKGQPGGILYILRSGDVQVKLDGPNPIDVAALSEGAIIGEMSFLTDDPASASVVAKSESVFYRLSRAAFSELMTSHSDLAFAVLVYILRHTATVIRNMNNEHTSMYQYIAGGRMGV